MVAPLSPAVWFMAPRHTLQGGLLKWEVSRLAGAYQRALMTDTSLVEVAVGDIRVIRQGRVVALASAELTVDGVSFVLHGMQVIRTRDATTGKDALGVDLPEPQACG